MNLRVRTLSAVAAIAIMSGCSAKFTPASLDSLDYISRAETLTKDGVTVTVAALTREETALAFGSKLDKNLIQPVYVKIENNSDGELLVIRHSLDPDYFSAYEASSLSQNYGNISNAKVEELFRDSSLEQFVRPGSIEEGFVFTNLSLGIKQAQVKLLTDDDEIHFEFFLTVPGLKADWQRTDFANLYSEDGFIDFDDPEEFRKTLEDFICCTTRKDGTGSGDPINMVVVGDLDQLVAFIKAGWDETEIISAGSSFRTAWSFVSGAEYKNSPISALYIFERPQDISLQKARNTIHERNHLRLWLAPWRFQGRSVWIGGISRDIGVFWTTRTWNLTSHAIDSEIDEARMYIGEDLATAETLTSLAFVDGVGLTTKENPKQNLLGTPWWTDGRRIVLFLADEETPLNELQVPDWSRRPGGSN